MVSNGVEEALCFLRDYLQRTFQVLSPCNRCSRLKSPLYFLLNCRCREKLIRANINTIFDNPTFVLMRFVLGATETQDVVTVEDIYRRNLVDFFLVA
jgi:hypothetical protein